MTRESITSKRIGQDRLASPYLPSLLAGEALPPPSDISPGSRAEWDFNPPDASAVRHTLSVNLTSARPSNRPCLGGLSGPTGLRLNRTDLPCSRQVLRLLASGTNPESVPTHSPYGGIGM